MIDFRPARTALNWGREERVFPGAAVEVGASEGVLWQQAVGRLTYDAASAPVTRDTVYDLASLTKVIATATVAMRLIATGRLSLDTTIRSCLPAWSGADRERVTVRDLLEHASGLPATALLHELPSRTAMFEAICRLPLEYAPRSASVYSDPGFILLGHVLELAGGATLDSLYRDAVSRIIAATDPVPLAFKPPSTWLPALAPGRLQDERGPIAPGQVDDLNAHALGGVAGHAGMFGTAWAVGLFARAVLQTIRQEGLSTEWIADPVLMRQFATRSTVSGSSRALAWDTMLPTSSCGVRMSARAIGHTGFTGTSLWIDPGSDLYVVFLSNRVHPAAGDNEAIQAVRRALHDAVFEAAR